MKEYFKWYRQYKGGTWYRIYFPHHYNHEAYTIWTQDLTLLDFPFFGQLMEQEMYSEIKIKYR